MDGQRVKRNNVSSSRTLSPRANLTADLGCIERMNPAKSAMSPRVCEEWAFGSYVDYSLRVDNADEALKARQCLRPWRSWACPNIRRGGDLRMSHKVAGKFIAQLSFGGS